MYVAAAHVGAFSLDSPIHIRVLTKPLSEQALYLLSYIDCLHNRLGHQNNSGSNLPDIGRFNADSFETQISYQNFARMFMGFNRVPTIVAELGKFCNQEDDRTQQALHEIVQGQMLWKPVYLVERRNRDLRSYSGKLSLVSFEPLPLPQEYFSSGARGSKLISSEIEGNPTCESPPLVAKYRAKAIAHLQKSVVPYLLFDHTSGAHAFSYAASVDHCAPNASWADFTAEEKQGALKAEFITRFSKPKNEIK